MDAEFVAMMTQHASARAYSKRKSNSTKQPVLSRLERAGYKKQP